MKQSFGGGYGIHRKHSGEKALGLAVPPHGGGASVKPGFSYSSSAVGRSGRKHFAGAKSYPKHGGKK